LRIFINNFSQLKARSELEKIKRRLESELKSSQVQLEEMGKAKQGVEEFLRLKVLENGGLVAKLDEERMQLAGAVKKGKEMSASVIVLEEELQSEKLARSRAEKVFKN